MQPSRLLNADREVQLILEKSFELNMVDIVVAVYAKRSYFKLYSYEIFQPQQCRKVSIQQINTFEKGKFQNPELFPYKFRNFHNCPMSIYIRNTSLFFKFNLTKDGTAVEYFEGVEANIIRVMEKKLNFNASLYYSQEDMFALVHENGTATGPFRLINENKVDIVFGYYHYPTRSRYFGESSSYALMPLVVVICNRDDRQFQGYWLIEPFLSLTWFILFLFAFIGIGLVMFTRYQSFRLWHFSKKIIWLDVIGLILGNARPLNIHYYTTKWSLHMCIFGYMILCGIFQGRLYNAFNRSRKNTPKTIEQLIDLNYTFIFRQSLDKDLIESLQIPPAQIRYLAVDVDPIIYEEMRWHSHNMATLTNYWEFQLYVETFQYYDEFDLVPLVVITNQICAYMRHHSYLIKPLNKILYSLDFAGIFKQWMVETTNFDKTNKIELSVKHNLSLEPKPLRLIQLRIVFTSMIVLAFISTLVFIGEIIFARKIFIRKKLRRMKKIFVTVLIKKK